MDTANAFFAILMAVALVAVVTLTGLHYLIQHVRGPFYRRGPSRSLKNGHFEFPVKGIGGLEDAEDFIAYLLKAALGQILDQSVEPDETWWRVGVPTDWITVIFDDPAGLRIRSRKGTQHGLYGRLLRDLKL